MYTKHKSYLIQYLLQCFSYITLYVGYKMKKQDLIRKPNLLSVTPEIRAELWYRFRYSGNCSYQMAEFEEICYA